MNNISSMTTADDFISKQRGPTPGLSAEPMLAAPLSGRTAGGSTKDGRRGRGGTDRHRAVTRTKSRPVRRGSSHVWILLLTMVVTVASGGLPLSSPALAQEDSGEPETLDETALAADEGLPAGGTGTDQPEDKTRSLLDTLIEGGFVGLLIGLLSVVALGFIIEHFISIRKSTLMPDIVANELETLIHEGKVEQAMEACNDPQNESLIADVVLSGLERYQASEFGFAEYKAAVEEAGEDQTGRLYRKTEVLGVIGSIAPMLGLTGTVLGMIEAFNMIASKGGAAQPDELAGGIGKALVTTLMGLIVAIPAMIAFSYFRNKIDSIVAETGKRVEQIMMPLGRRRQP
jgi:biopolymer transport protein ExbB